VQRAAGTDHVEKVWHPVPGAALKAAPPRLEPLESNN
jgi:hypothetical protein